MGKLCKRNSNSMHFHARLPGDITSDIRAEDCSTGTFWELVSGRDQGMILVRIRSGMILTIYISKCAIGYFWHEMCDACL